MKVEQLTKTKTKDFLNYCRKHREEVDGSFLHEEDLKEFESNEENPTYILLNEKDEIKGVISLIINEYYRKGGKGRFRIFHCEEKNIELYNMLFNKLLSSVEDIEDIENVFIFIEEEKKDREMVEELGFKIERWSFLLKRDDEEIEEVSFPEGYNIRPMEFGKDEEKFCHVRNEAFAKLAGNQTKITPNMIKGMKDSEDFIEGGVMLLYHNDKAMGLIRVTKDIIDEEPCAFIGPLAILPEYQGKGLGRKILRAGLKFGIDNDLPVCYLCVNAENQSALKLYLHEGFSKDETMLCYNYGLK